MVLGEAKASLIESAGGAMAACTGLYLPHFIHVLFINKHVAPIAGRHGRVKPSPETPIQVWLWRSTNLSTIDSC
jgi:hypothetical protein